MRVYVFARGLLVIGSLFSLGFFGETILNGVNLILLRRGVRRLIAKVDQVLILSGIVLQVQVMVAFACSFGLPYRRVLSRRHLNMGLARQRLV
jgi:hypothetical protein